MRRATSRTRNRSHHHVRISTTHRQVVRGDTTIVFDEWHGTLGLPLSSGAWRVSRVTGARFDFKRVPILNQDSSDEDTKETLGKYQTMEKWGVYPQTTFTGPHGTIVVDSHWSKTRHSQESRFTLEP